jgi:hypothetical protein
VVALRVVLLDTHRALVELSDFLAYRDAITFVVNTKFRRELSDDPLVPTRRVGQPPPAAFLAYGVQLRDGRSATNVASYLGIGASDQDLRLTVGEGIHRPGASSQRAWLTPLPPPDALKFACRWPAVTRGEETLADVDGRAFYEASRRSHRPPRR